jgi:hypothetical protein
MDQFLTLRAIPLLVLVSLILCAQTAEPDLEREVTGVQNLLLDRRELPDLGPPSASLGDEDRSFAWTSDRKAHWLRAEVRDSNGSLMLVSNPVYINFSSVEKSQ